MSNVLPRGSRTIVDVVLRSDNTNRINEGIIESSFLFSPKAPSDPISVSPNGFFFFFVFF